MKTNERVVLYPLDLLPLAGESTRTANELYKKIMNHFNFKRPVRITVLHVAKFYDVSEKEMRKMLRL